MKMDQLQVEIGRRGENMAFLLRLTLKVNRIRWNGTWEKELSL